MVLNLSTRGSAWKAGVIHTEEAKGRSRRPSRREEPALVAAMRTHHERAGLEWVGRQRGLRFLCDWAKQ